MRRGLRCGDDGLMRERVDSENQASSRGRDDDQIDMASHGKKRDAKSNRQHVAVRKPTVSLRRRRTRSHSDGRRRPKNEAAEQYLGQGAVAPSIDTLQAVALTIITHRPN
jgi:hypothetical protein